ncbi:uncharacterized protein EKO05_0006711 [Ascochyta rabiei]|uniref:uncharacterized protein n=1 Tax=Didymella rabiei TaxID=5454 RepID=UPI00220B9860|nr:uncharacterized protein EKO05_0006711 [Ascochyta rabiei]UPX16302.1 hypothetical protein EKO05_0006711 [Ascochyta rabiei]
MWIRPPLTCRAYKYCSGRCLTIKVSIVTFLRHAWNGGQSRGLDVMLTLMAIACVGSIHAGRPGPPGRWLTTPHGSSLSRAGSSVGELRHSPITWASAVAAGRSST